VVKMVMEHPRSHPNLHGKEIDPSLLTPTSWGLEAKCHRAISSGPTFPPTQQRGALVADLYRLALTDATDRHLRYVAERTLVAHL
jgi:hypothetical protein